MKIFGNNNYRVSFFMAAMIMIFFYGCTKTIHDRRPTTTNTPESREFFGFVLNGRGFQSEARTGNVYGICTYKEIDGDTSVFRISSDHAGGECISNNIEIVLDRVELREGMRFVLGTPGRGKNYLVCSSVVECSKPAIKLTTKDGVFGFLRITKYKPDIQVISGVFSCIVTNDQGVTSQIADGYFDRHYTE
jgi:hypothetical protein